MSKQLFRTLLIYDVDDKWRRGLDSGTRNADHGGQYRLSILFEIFDNISDNYFVGLTSNA